MPCFAHAARQISRIALMLLVLGSGVASADYVHFTFTGNVDYVLTDDGSGMFTGVGVGAPVAGVFDYGVDASDASVTPHSDNETDYLFAGSSYGSQINSGALSTGSDQATIVASNSTPIGVSTPLDTPFTELSALAGFPIDVGDPFDGWSAENLSGPVGFGLTLFSFTDLGWTTDESYLAIPPPAGDFTAFFIRETNGAGDVTYFAIGAVDTLDFTVVPLPPAAWLFGAGLIALFSGARKT